MFSKEKRQFDFVRMAISCDLREQGWSFVVKGRPCLQGKIHLRAVVPCVSLKEPKYGVGRGEPNRGWLHPSGLKAKLQPRGSHSETPITTTRQHPPTPSVMVTLARPSSPAAIGTVCKTPASSSFVTI